MEGLQPGVAHDGNGHRACPGRQERAQLPGAQGQAVVVVAHRLRDEERRPRDQSVQERHLARGDLVHGRHPHRGSAGRVDDDPQRLRLAVADHDSGAGGGVAETVELAVVESSPLVVGGFYHRGRRYRNRRMGK
ncbi:hypothetical protein DEA06_10115 [Microbacterium sp. Gd 4-13]|nr:hypothetical protein DEA06_10115 [Microbacterium sp. Gd 4-13]